MARFLNQPFQLSVISYQLSIKMEFHIEYLGGLQALAWPYRSPNFSLAVVRLTGVQTLVWQSSKFGRISDRFYPSKQC